MNVSVESARSAFETRGWNLLGRGAWQRDGEVVLENACTSGFDLQLRCTSGRRGASPIVGDRLPRDRAAARILRSRFHLLARAVLIQYPALWWAGCAAGLRCTRRPARSEGRRRSSLLPSGIGRSTLLRHELGPARAPPATTSPSGDGTTLWGLVEPMRVEDGSGRRMPHGRHEAAMAGRVEALEPDSVVVLERGSDHRSSLRRAARRRPNALLVTSTYMAGELRRYWPFAATLAAGNRGRSCSSARDRGCGRVRRGGRPRSHSRWGRAPEHVFPTFSRPRRLQSAREPPPRPIVQDDASGLRVFDSATSPADHLRWQSFERPRRRRISPRLPWCCPTSTSRTTRRCRRASPSPPRDTIRPTLTSASVNCGMTLVGAGPRRPTRRAVTDFFRVARAAIRTRRPSGET